METQIASLLGGFGGFALGLMIVLSLAITVLTVYLLILMIQLARYGIKALKKYTERRY